MNRKWLRRSRAGILDHADLRAWNRDDFVEVVVERQVEGDINTGFVKRVRVDTVQVHKIIYLEGARALQTGISTRIRFAKSSDGCSHFCVNGSLKFHKIVERKWWLEIIIVELDVSRGAWVSTMSYEVWAGANGGVVRLVV